MALMLLVVLIFCGCAGYSGLKLTSSQKLYRAKCTSCHRLVPKEFYTRQTAESYVAKYGKKLTGEEKLELIEHLSPVE